MRLLFPVFLLVSVTTVNSHFKPLRGYTSIYLCFSTSHGALHSAQPHTQRVAAPSAAAGKVGSLCGPSDLENVGQLKERETTGGGVMPFL